MFAYTLTSKPCSEATNMLYLASGVLFVDSLGNQLEGNLEKRTGDVEFQEIEPYRIAI